MSGIAPLPRSSFLCHCPLCHDRPALTPEPVCYIVVCTRWFATACLFAFSPESTLSRRAALICRAVTEDATAPAAEWRTRQRHGKCHAGVWQTCSSRRCTVGNIYAVDVASITRGVRWARAGCHRCLGASLGWAIIMQRVVYIAQKVRRCQSDGVRSMSDRLISGTMPYRPTNADAMQDNERLTSARPWTSDTRESVGA